MVDIVPAHTPYDGSAKPFTIGLKPLDPNEWIEVDDRLETYLAEKERLLATMPGEVFVAEADTLAAQREVLDMLVEFLPRRFPETYRLDGDVISVGQTDRRVRICADDPAPLRTASLLVQEDLVLMRRAPEGWRLAAGCVCFPSSWTLAEKFGKPLNDIHVPVPDFGPGTRAATLIERIFDRLAVEQPVERMNWSLTVDPSLHLPLSSVQRTDRADDRQPRFPADIAGGAFVRVERQTLRKLPVSGDLLFTIRIHVDPVAAIARHPRRGEIAASFAEQLAALDAAQLGYKGMTVDRDRLAAALREIAETEAYSGS